MSFLNGMLDTASRIYGAMNIERHIRQYAWKNRRYGNTSYYQPHQSTRECERRLRQQQRNEERQIERAKTRRVRSRGQQFAFPDGPRVSRRGFII